MARKTKGLLAEIAEDIVHEDLNLKEKHTQSKLQKRVALVGDISSDRVRNKKLRLIEPEKCKMWDHHNRQYDLLDEKNCGDLISNILAVGEQKIPAIVRELNPPKDGFEYEVIAGARRHFSISHIRNTQANSDFLFLIDIQDLTDEEAFLIGDLENRDREDISDYERALDYTSALSFFYRGSIAEMSTKMNVTDKWLSRYLALAKLPSNVIELIEDVRDLKRDHAEKLLPLLSKPSIKRLIDEEAVHIKFQQLEARKTYGQFHLSAVQVVQALVKAGSSNIKTTPIKDLQHLTAKDGSKLASAEIGKRTVTIKIPRRKGMDISSILSKIEAAIDEDGSGKAS